MHDSYTKSNAYCYTCHDTDPYTNFYTHVNVKSDPDANIDPGTYANPKSYTNAEPYSDANTDPRSSDKPYGYRCVI